MNLITWLLLLLALIVLARLIILVRKASRPQKHTIQLAEPQPKDQSNPGLPGLLLILLLFLMAAAVVAQFLLGRMN